MSNYTSAKKEISRINDVINMKKDTLKVLETQKQLHPYKSAEYDKLIKNVNEKILFLTNLMKDTEELSKKLEKLDE